MNLKASVGSGRPLFCPFQAMILYNLNTKHKYKMKILSPYISIKKKGRQIEKKLAVSY